MRHTNVLWPAISGGAIIAAFIGLAIDSTIMCVTAAIVSVVNAVAYTYILKKYERNNT